MAPIHRDRTPMTEREFDMAFASDTQRAAQGTSTWGRLADLRTSLIERFATYRMYRSTLAELEGLSDRDLTDLGLTRGDIRDVAWNSAYRA
jgi:uncharacterized protein YjiS (DUF1127 family)